jgi:hypothetical protein
MPTDSHKNPTTEASPISSRSQLLTLLSEACELEHGLACSYLYTAFTLKTDLREGGLTWQQLQLVRQWAAQIYFVASQEMLHLAQVWNLLTAIGGTPYYYRPNFPQGSRYYSLGQPLILERFGRRALQRFRYYERPADIDPNRHFFTELGIPLSEASTPSFRTVGELYRIVLAAIKTLPEDQLFVGKPADQVGTDLIDFPDIVKVVDRGSATEAINRITHQGEGTAADRADCHFGMFTTVLRELEAVETGAGGNFHPARLCIKNPITEARGDYLSLKGSIIEDTYTQQVSDLFDDIYMLMMRMLSYVFSNASGDAGTVKRFAAIAIGLMPTVVLPLGEALTLLPAGTYSYGNQTAGPTFGLTRHVLLPADAGIASTVVRERADELIAIADKLSADSRAPEQLKNCSRNLRLMFASCATPI